MQFSPSVDRTDNHITANETGWATMEVVPVHLMCKQTLGGRGVGMSPSLLRVRLLRRSGLRVRPALPRPQPPAGTWSLGRGRIPRFSKHFWAHEGNCGPLGTGRARGLTERVPPPLQGDNPESHRKWQTWDWRLASHEPACLSVLSRRRAEPIQRVSGTSE